MAIRGKKTPARHTRRTRKPKFPCFSMTKEEIQHFAEKKKERNLVDAVPWRKEKS